MTKKEKQEIKNFLNESTTLSWTYKTVGDFVIFIPSAKGCQVNFGRLRSRLPQHSYSWQPYKSTGCVACPDWHNPIVPYLQKEVAIV